MGMTTVNGGGKAESEGERGRKGLCGGGGEKDVFFLSYVECDIEQKFFFGRW